MSILLQHETGILDGKIQITGSKSISNRFLVLNHLFENVLQFKNLSNSDDTKQLQNALTSDSETIDIHHAGTAMRFLTAYFSQVQNRNLILTGSTRMQERPIQILVEALIHLGAKITYTQNPGFPPLEIQGKKWERNEITLSSSVSSQYITALMLVGSKCENGLTIFLKGKITSLPYLLMTIDLMKSIGITIEFNKNVIQIQPQTSILAQNIIVESDWSSASYYFSLLSLAKSGNIQISHFQNSSLQGDSKIREIYETYFGIESKLDSQGILYLRKQKNHKCSEAININLNETPDIAQTIAVTCAGLKKTCVLKGLETLKIKETNRLQALKNELGKLGCQVSITNESLEIHDFDLPQKDISIQTYQDHRMAMAFAPYSLKKPIRIQNQEVVEKSYPSFWEDLKMLNFSIE